MEKKKKILTNNEHKQQKKKQTNIQFAASKMGTTITDI